MRRVLFVDDDQLILDALRAGLRRHRDVWDMVFVCGGRGALEALRVKHFDALVTDARMPDIDGEAVLRAAREQSPDTVRVILSGQTDELAAARMVDLAHRYVAKPFECRALFELVESACSRRDGLGNPAVRAFVTGLNRLPAVPRTYARLKALTEKPDTGTGDVARVIMEDPALSARVLRVVNSAFFGLAQKMASVPAAAAYLGLKQLRALVLDAELAVEFSHSGLEPALVEATLQRSRRAAAIVRQLAPRADAAFTACILADVGQLLLAMEEPTRWAERRLASGGDCATLAELERAAFGCDHFEVGAYLLSLWGLSSDIVEAAAGHQTRPAPLGQEPTTAQLVAVAFGALEPRHAKDGAWFEPVAPLYEQARALAEQLSRET